MEDYYIQNRCGWVRLHEKGGKVTELPCHHNLEQFLDEWLSASGLAVEPTAPPLPYPQARQACHATTPGAGQCA